MLAQLVHIFVVSLDMQFPYTLHYKHIKRPTTNYDVIKYAHVTDMITSMGVMCRCARQCTETCKCVRFSDNEHVRLVDAVPYRMY